jgi:5-methyltetrahydrofolate--homocysteine methyltransferase
MLDPLTKLLQKKNFILGDGAMGTNLFDLGLANGEPGELWNLNKPQLVAQVYQGFVDAGSEIILSNSFGANKYRFMLHSDPALVKDANITAARIAREVIDGCGRPVIVAGSMGPTGEMPEPYGERPAADIEEAFYEQAMALKQGGVDIIWIETMFFEDEIDAAAKAVERAGLAYVQTMTFDTNGCTMMGLKPQNAPQLKRDRGWNSIAFGANCGVGPSQLVDTIIGICDNSSDDDVIVAKANCGIPQMGADMKIAYDGTPEIMANYACMARDAGARIIGGCCGTKPVHIAAMREALDIRPRGDRPSHEQIGEVLGNVTKTSRQAIKSSRKRTRARHRPKRS